MNPQSKRIVLQSEKSVSLMTSISKIGIDNLQQDFQYNASCANSMDRQALESRFDDATKDMWDMLFSSKGLQTRKMEWLSWNHAYLIKSMRMIVSSSAGDPKSSLRAAESALINMPTFERGFLNNNHVGNLNYLKAINAVVVDKVAAELRLCDKEVTMKTLRLFLFGHFKTATQFGNGIMNDFASKPPATWEWATVCTHLTSVYLNAQDILMQASGYYGDGIPASNNQTTIMDDEELLTASGMNEG